uniref:Uncharacterized protein n=1 Tax=Arundo donax TaxID=35708 RepID=A0A0A8YNA2_ARUDO
MVLKPTHCCCGACTSKMHQGRPTHHVNKLAFHWR